MIVRPYEPLDLEAVYEICLKTGDRGEDATHLYDDPKLLGHLYVGPYVVLEPESAWVLADEAGVCGYIVGALDSRTFYETYRQEWLPPLRAHYPEPQGRPEEWTRDEALRYRLHHPRDEPPQALAAYPSHLHIDLLPHAQGQGWGRKLMQTFLGSLETRGSRGVHLSVGRQNTRAIAFYRRLGFKALELESELYFTMDF